MVKAVLSTILVSLALTSGAAYAADLSQRPVRILVGFSPGGGIDDTARILGLAMGRELGQPVVIDNRPGASTLIAAEALKNAPPDGQTLMLATTSTLLAMLVQERTRTANQKVLDPRSTFAAVASVGQGPFVIVAHQSFPASDVPGFIKEVHDHPGKYFYATSGIGSQHHLGMEVLMQSLDLRMTHVPYKGAGQILPDLMGGGQIKLAVMSSVSARTAAEKEEGRLKIIGVLSGPRIPALPNLQSFSEKIPNFDDATSHSFLVAPPGTPPAVIDKIAAAVQRSLKDPQVLKSLASSDTAPDFMDPPTLAKDIQAFVDKWGRVVAKVNFAK